MKIDKRNNISDELKWNLTDLVKDDIELYKRLDELADRVKGFVSFYRGNLKESFLVGRAIDAYKLILEEMTILQTYSHLARAVEMGNVESSKRDMKVSSVITELGAELSFLNSELLQLNENVLVQTMESYPANSLYLEELLRQKPHMLGAEAEAVIASLSDALDAPYAIYLQSKLVDITFEDFEVGGVSYPLSYNIFEGVMESEPNTEVRRAAYREFYKQLSAYQHTTAACYNARLQNEKTMSRLRGFDSVIDYLLFDQRVDRELYSRQIEVIMAELAPHMRKYAKLIKRVHGLDQMKFADLKLNLDPGYAPKVDMKKAKEFITDGLSVLGDEYKNILDRAFSERWIDFANNEGKSTGAFCSSPYGVHSYILISWTELMEQVLVLAHELGHAGHFSLCQEYQDILNTRPSMYFIEAPSTANEIIMETYLLNKAEDERERRWVLSQIISRTYYHNFVTHLIEAAYQNEVYKIIDAGGSVQAETLNRIFKEKLEEFWGEDVEITPGSELTWMRQPHYYNGLYPYTYSAGLTIGTQVAKRIVKEGAPAVEDWLNTLKTGGRLDPVELAMMAGVDIRTDKPLRDTIAYIGQVIDELEKMF